MYTELVAIARAKMAGERAGHTLQASERVALAAKPPISEFLVYESTQEIGAGVYEKQR